MVLPLKSFFFIFWIPKHFVEYLKGFKLLNWISISSSTYEQIKRYKKALSKTSPFKRTQCNYTNVIVKYDRKLAKLNTNFVASQMFAV